MPSPQLLDILRAYWRMARPGSACTAAGLGKHVTVHTLRHSFATHLLKSGTDIRIIQALLGHRSVNTTAPYAQVATSTIRGTPSPLDRLRWRRSFAATALHSAIIMARIWVEWCVMASVEGCRSPARRLRHSVPRSGRGNARCRRSIRATPTGGFHQEVRGSAEPSGG